MMFRVVNNLSTRKNLSVSCRSNRYLYSTNSTIGLESLTLKHREFLSLVANHGEGSVELSIDDKIARIVISNEKNRNSITGKMMMDLATIVDGLSLSVSVSNSSSKNSKISSNSNNNSNSNSASNSSGDSDSNSSCNSYSYSASNSNINSNSSNLVGIVLHGTGNKAFSSGADFKLVKTIINTPEKGRLMCEFMTDALERIRRLSLISVCVLNGSALGGGSELITATDYRLMVTNQTDNSDYRIVNSAKNDFFIRYVHATIGASPGWGGSFRLTNLIGRSKSLYYVASSQPITPTKAKEIGLVDDLVSITISNYSTDSKSNETSAMAEKYEDVCYNAGKKFLEPFTTQKYPGALHAIKETIASLEYENSSTAREIEKQMFQNRWYSADNVEALART